MGTPNFQNRTLFHGDNLPFLRSMNSESVHLIATDPPFNKGKDFHATPDSLAAGARFQDRWSWADDVEQTWVDQIADDWPRVMTVINGARESYGDDMGAFLCFIGVRLLEMHRILRKDGSIYLHCDPTASHYLKQLMDAVFGTRNFRNEIAWCYTGPSNTRRWFPRKHDTLLFYVKSDKANFYRDAVRIPYSEETLARRGRVEGEQSIIAPSVETVGRRDKDQVDVQFGNGKVPEDWWPDVPIITNQVEKTGYPTQKPLALYERIIKASSNSGDIVLDPFCGCATTPVAAERLGRQWVGMDIWDKAHETVIERLQNEGLAAPDGSSSRLFTFGQIHYETVLPIRTDGGMEAAPFIQVTERYAEPDGPRMSRSEMYEHLLAQHGQRCQGCDRVFDDPRYLELDHNTPRSDGGMNHITNRILLCSPCNRAKSNQYTLSGLRRLNQRNGWMGIG